MTGKDLEMMFRIAILFAVLSSSTALANGNNLTMTGATYDTAGGQKFGSSALSGGFGVTPAGACYANPSAAGFNGSVVAFPIFEKEVWVKMTTLPSTPELIFGDQAAYLAVDVNGNVVFGSGSISYAVPKTYVNSQGQLEVTPGWQVADGAWHRVQIFVGPPATGPESGFYQAGAFLAGVVDGVPRVPLSETPSPMFANANAPYSTSTGVGGGVAVTWTGAGTLSANAQLTAFTGELDEAACFVAGPEGSLILRAAPPWLLPTSAYTGSEIGEVALYHLDGNGNDSATWMLPTTQ